MLSWGMAVVVLKTRVLNGLLICVKGVPWPHLEGPELLRRMDQKKNTTQQLLYR